MVEEGRASFEEEWDEEGFGDADGGGVVQDFRGVTRGEDFDFRHYGGRGMESGDEVGVEVVVIGRRRRRHGGGRKRRNVKLARLIGLGVRVELNYHVSVSTRLVFLAILLSALADLEKQKHAFSPPRCVLLAAFHPPCQYRWCACHQ